MTAYMIVQTHRFTRREQLLDLYWTLYPGFVMLDFISGWITFDRLHVSMIEQWASIASWPELGDW